MSRPTDRQRVLARYPNAVCKRLFDCWAIWISPATACALARARGSSGAAWREARRRVEDPNSTFFKKVVTPGKVKAAPASVPAKDKDGKLPIIRWQSLPFLTPLQQIEVITKYGVHVKWLENEEADDDVESYVCSGITSVCGGSHVSSTQTATTEGERIRCLEEVLRRLHYGEGRYGSGFIRWSDETPSNEWE